MYHHRPMFYIFCRMDNANKNRCVNFFVLGLCGSIGNLLLTQSYRLAEASLVTPIKYLSLVFAIIFGFFIWSETPKVLTLLGAALVILSSFIIFIRESHLKRQIITSGP